MSPSNGDDRPEKVSPYHHTDRPKAGERLLRSLLGSPFYLY